VPQNMFFWEDFGGKGGNILLENGGANTKAAAGGGVQRKSGRTKRSKMKKNTKSVNLKLMTQCETVGV